MNTSLLQQKKETVLGYERDLGTRLACKIFDKPKPPLWMIFVPVFFLFFMQKMKEYKTGLQDFVENHLIARQRALDMAIEVMERGTQLDPSDLKSLGTRVPEHARTEYMRWMELMIEHFLQLLEAKGQSCQDLVKNSYQNKTNFLLFCHNLNTAEKAYNQALLPGLEGETEDLRTVINKIGQHLEILRREDADKFFS